jgi:hypothetical protein
MRRHTLPLLTVVLLALGTGTSGAVVENVNPPIVTSDNVDLVWSNPAASPATSMAFSPDSPHVFVSTRKGIETYDISNPELPVPVGYYPMVIDQNENMSIGYRPAEDEDGEDVKFVLIGSNGALVNHEYQVTTNRHVIVVDVTDPESPTAVADIETPSRTHTITCVNPECTYAYSDGRAQGEISIVDLRDWRDPQIAGTFRSVVTLGHDADYDATGLLWHVGGEGSVALDVTDPENPVQLNSTTVDGTRAPWNRFIHHNSERPFAENFAHLVDEEGNPIRDEDGNLTSGEPAIDSGNVLLVTEEFIVTNAATCPTGDGEGAFQTWHVPFLDADEYDRINPDHRSGHGTIRPLDRWQTELMESGETLRQPGFCSAHYFHFHPAGITTNAFYEQGTRFLDVRDPHDIKQVGYFFTPDQETFDARWVPAYDEDGVQTGELTNIVYTTDHVRGMDVLRFDLESLPDPEDTENLRAPILPEWLVPRPDLQARWSPDYGYACRL